MTDDHDTPQRPRFHGFLLYVFIMNLVAMLIVGALQLIGAALATTTVCGWLPPAYPKARCPYSLPDPWAPVAEPEPVTPEFPIAPQPEFPIAPQVQGTPQPLLRFEQPLPSLLRFEPLKFGN